MPALNRTLLTVPDEKRSVIAVLAASGAVFPPFVIALPFTVAVAVPSQESV
ncbi:hypothetical protein D9M72_591290 [compost metagenome]